MSNRRKKKINCPILNRRMPIIDKNIKYAKLAHFYAILQI